MTSEPPSARPDRHVPPGPKRKMPSMLKEPYQLVRRFAGSLSFKLSFYAGLIMFLALVAFVYQSIRSQERDLSAGMVREALKDSEVIKAAIWDGMMTKDRRVIREIVKAIGLGHGFEKIDIYDRNGLVRYSSHADPLRQDFKTEREPLLKEIGTNTLIRHRISEDGQWIHVVNPLVNTKSCSTAACHAHPENHKVLGALAIKFPLTEYRKEIYRNARNATGLAFALFVVISTCIGLAVIFLVNPSIKKLQENAGKVARGEYEPQEPSRGAGEMAELSRSFDAMSRHVHRRTTRLAESRRMYKSLFEEVPCYLTAVDRDYRIVRANRAFREQFGDLVGKHCFAGYKGLDSKCDDCPVEKTFADGLSHRSEHTWLLGIEKAYVIVDTAPIFDDEGNIAEVLEMSLDVTAMKQLQMELERKKQEYQYLFAKVPCYLTVINPDFEIGQTNTLFRRDFGDRVGQKCFKVYKNRDARCPNCPVEKTFADGLSHESEEVWRRNGEEAHVIVHTAPITDDEGKIISVIEMSTNITEVKRLQSELALLGETIAGMSHTIKNILSGLQGGVYVVDSGLERSKGERVRQGWSMVKRNVEKVSELVRGILYAAKEREPEYEECDPGRLLTEVCDLYEERAKAEGASLKRDFRPVMQPGPLDPAGFHSALSNLLSNALDACRGADAGGNLVTVSGRVEAGTLTVEVTDNGVGIPGEVRDKLFSKFYSTKGSKGTGLGLLMTRKVTEEHGGTIHVESEPGRGSRFVIEIPLKPAQEANGLRTAV